MPQWQVGAEAEAEAEAEDQQQVNAADAKAFLTGDILPETYIAIHILPTTPSLHLIISWGSMQQMEKSARAFSH
ncbi:uncharacterized protein LODBEIA_P03150 [Lodderomyces beijingensis]|uniref:Uncharacterized protein n=1 Tax=Lodderomyces beijingensis TaxID=1775926 RepID=A0ABP0ZGX7_9ASCO